MRRYFTWIVVVLAVVGLSACSRVGSTDPRWFRGDEVYGEVYHGGISGNSTIIVRESKEGGSGKNSCSIQVEIDSETDDLVIEATAIAQGPSCGNLGQNWIQVHARKECKPRSLPSLDIPEGPYLWAFRTVPAIRTQIGDQIFAEYQAGRTEVLITPSSEPDLWELYSRALALVDQARKSTLTPEHRTYVYGQRPKGWVSPLSTGTAVKVFE